MLWEINLGSSKSTLMGRRAIPGEEEWEEVGKLDEEFINPK